VEVVVSLAVDREAVADPPGLDLDPVLDPAVGATAVAVEAEAHPPHLIAAIVAGGGEPGRIPRAAGHHTHLEAVAVAVAVVDLEAGAEAAALDGGGAGVEATAAVAGPGHHRLVHIPRVAKVAV
jgi:hypothetical protein